MAMELKKQMLETETVISAQRAQLNLQTDAMVSGAGRDAIEVLMEDALVRLNNVQVQAGRLSVEGMVVCQAAYRQGEGDIIRAVEARAPLQHAFEDENIAIGMNGSAEACVTHVETGYLNGRILFRVTVEIAGTVASIAATEVITQIEGVDGVQCETVSVESVRQGAEAVAQVNVSETLSLPQELDTQATLMDFATVTIEKAERDLGGVMASGRVNAEVMIAGGIPGKPVAMVKYPMAFSQLVEMPEWLTGNVQVCAAVDSIRSALVETGTPGEIGLKLEAEITLRVCAIQTQQISCIGDAYAVGASDLSVEQQRIGHSESIRRENWEDTFRGTLLIPESQQPVGSVLAAHGRASVTGWEKEKGGSVIEGVLEVAALYMPSGGGHPVTVRDELPFRIACAKPLPEDAQIVADVISCEASALMSDRMEMRCMLRFRMAARQAASAEMAVMIREMEAEPRRPGIVMVWPGTGDTAWSIARRYHVPVADVLQETGSAALQAGKALVLRM